MDETILRDKVGELLSAVTRLPVEGKAPSVELPRLASSEPSTIRRDMAALEENIDQVRLAIKYLVFDLEATKRENRLLREMLGEA
jgi:hypothetical protein